MSHFEDKHFSPDTRRHFSAVLDYARHNTTEADWFRTTYGQFKELTDSANNKHNEASTRVLSYWAKSGLVPHGKGHRQFSLFEIAMTQILVVLRKRGLALGALETVKSAMDGVMHQDPRTGAQITFLEFAVTYVGISLNTKSDGMGDLYLVINGDNQCSFARAEDLSSLVANDAMPTQDSPSTFSHTVLNLSRVLRYCNFIEKIGRYRDAFISDPQRGAQRHDV